MTHRLDDLCFRDPCILPDQPSGLYYLCASIRTVDDRPGVGVYTSRDLAEWQGPTVVFSVSDGFWAQAGIWAPELHRYKDKYYLFLTFNTHDTWREQRDGWPPRVDRASQVLVSDSPLGPFQPFRNEPHLPREKMTLDGTLWVENGVPHMVYCREWVDIVDGTIEVVQLADDLSAIVGEPLVLFRGSDAPWIGADQKGRPSGFVTDGSYLYRTGTGHLLMVWSTFGAGGYATVVAHSQSDTVFGPWVQQSEPLFSDDGGHAMIFRRFDGQLILTLLQPNCSPDERARLFALANEGETIGIQRRVA